MRNYRKKGTGKAEFRFQRNPQQKEMDAAMEQMNIEAFCG